ncbi:hypothetical protein SCA6_004000 [Theobroma cacao]
MFWE